MSSEIVAGIDNNNSIFDDLTPQTRSLIRRINAERNRDLIEAVSATEESIHAFLKSFGISASCKVYEETRIASLDESDLSRERLENGIGRMYPVFHHTLSLPGIGIKASDLDTFASRICPMLSHGEFEASKGQIGNGSTNDIESVFIKKKIILILNT